MDLDRDYPAVTAAARAVALAEFQLWQTIIDEHAAGETAVDALAESVYARQIGHHAVTLDLAQILHLSEDTYAALHWLACQTAQRLPHLWDTFAAGEVDSSRVRAIGYFLRRATTQRFTDFLNDQAVDYATTHTAGEVRRYLHRWYNRLEAQTALKEAEQVVEGRRVDIQHHDNHTSTLTAILPTRVALAIAHRLRQAVKNLPTHHPDPPDHADTEIDGIDSRVRDTRTVDQKQADLVAHWLTSCTGTDTEVKAEIAISIDATDLTHQPGTTRDGAHPVPAEWVRELAMSETTLFRRLVLDPTGQILDTTSLGYQPAGALREALRWRDGCCRVAGCHAPIHDTDLDHRRPYHRGGCTDADNLQNLCRKHHIMKSHGWLTRKHLRPPPSYRERLHHGPGILIDLVQTDPDHPTPTHPPPPPRPDAAPRPRALPLCPVLCLGVGLPPRRGRKPSPVEGADLIRESVRLAR